MELELSILLLTDSVSLSISGPMVDYLSAQLVCVFVAVWSPHLCPLVWNGYLDQHLNSESHKLACVKASTLFPLTTPALILVPNCQGKLLCNNNVPNRAFYLIRTEGHSI